MLVVSSQSYDFDAAGVCRESVLPTNLGAAVHCLVLIRPQSLLRGHG
jgi:hypothetical protein